MSTGNESSTEQQKIKMLNALAKKQKVQISGRVNGTSTGSKVGAGNLSNIGPKIHRRKTGPS